MIRDLSLTLRAILDDPTLSATFPELAAAQIVFDRPIETFNPTQTTVDLFLYDIRENTELRSNEPIVQRGNGQVTIVPPPLRVSCSYLVTAWPVGGIEMALQEHRLLSQALQVLSRHPTIPSIYLQGSLIGQEPPLPLMAARADGLPNPAEFWTSLGSRLRASFTVTVTIAMDVFAPEIAPMVITQEVELQQMGLPATQEEFFRIGGRVTDAGNQPIANVTVTLAEPGLATITDADGRYTLGRITAGTYTLRVQSGATIQQVSITVPATTGSNYNVQLV